MSPQQPDPPAVPSTPQPEITPAATTEVDALPSPTVELIIEPTTEPIQESNGEPQGSAPSPEVEWMQEAFGDAWNIGYPASWTVNAAGANEGALQLQGEYDDHSYEVTFAYPIGILPASLDEWVEGFLAPLTPEQRQAVVVSDVTVANTPAKKVLNFPAVGSAAGGNLTAHHVYLWRSEGKNPRLITISQTDEQPFDAGAMEQLLDRFISAVQ